MNLTMIMIMMILMILSVNTTGYLKQEENF